MPDYAETITLPAEVETVRALQIDGRLCYRVTAWVGDYSVTVTHAEAEAAGLFKH